MPFGSRVLAHVYTHLTQKCSGSRFGCMVITTKNLTFLLGAKLAPTVGLPQQFFNRHIAHLYSTNGTTYENRGFRFI